MLTDWFRLDQTCGFTVERFANHQVPITCLGTIVGTDEAVLHFQLKCGLIQFNFCQTQQDGSDFSRSSLNCRCAIGHGERACSHAFIGHQGCISGDDVDSGEIDIQLICTDLGDRGQDALTQLDLADAQFHHLAGAVNANPGIEFSVNLQVASQPGLVGRRGRLRMHIHQRNAKTQSESAR